MSFRNDLLTPIWDKITSNNDNVGRVECPVWEFTDSMTVVLAGGMGVWGNVGIDNFKREEKEIMF